MKIKVCGMKYHENIEVIGLSLKPDYLGFIFYENSPRNFTGSIPALASSIKKVGVFVDASIHCIMDKVSQYGLKAIQLHGEESAAFCRDLKSKLINDKTIATENGSVIEIWKVFSIKNEFDFDRLKPFEGIVDYFLFDTKGKEKGGNGYTFDWSVLEDYPSTTPFILSGGIGVEEVEKVKKIRGTKLPIHAIDVNSKFEIKPGLKNGKLLEKFKKLLVVTI
ncbi:phosphoribosylanthranilate isomerase [Aquimarina sp. U1-2]|uniref:phosphoribosylanthranilate isomerase n=1 Tax=Aquimarina sp. U1-2 TaxID=2823141 RepID=UPI001AEC9B0F|nr:phosphoribosylanthranilate isomerase [Aquimarina sp. U1-2]MBP2830768.1 phosphoribosylanthranilate isomerase [Aquimarina sp. U1-2]